MNDEKGGRMKELDFDELHEAVNKLMDQAQQPKTAKRAPIKPVARPDSRPPVRVTERQSLASSEPSHVAQVKEPKKTDDKKADIPAVTRVAVRRPAAQAVPKLKKRGMAMDVVQPTKPAVIKPPSVRTGHTAPSLQPTKPIQPEPPKPRGVTTPAAPKESVPPSRDDIHGDTLASLNIQADGTTSHAAPANDSATGLRIPEIHQSDAPAGRTSVPPVREEDVPVHRDQDRISPLDEPPVQPLPPVSPQAHQPGKDQPAPAIEPSPFVNANIKKRPLGAYAGAPESTAPSSSVSAIPAEEPIAAPQPAEAEPRATPEPTVATHEELSPEVVAVESTETNYPASGTDMPLHNLRQMSIPQQYRAPDKEPSHDDRPVFDTKDYHTPLHPAGVVKHSAHSISNVLLMVLLVILLMAAGFIAYFIATGSIELR